LAQRPITDRSGESCYLRDEDSGRLLVSDSTAGGGTKSLLTRHGFGYSVFETTQHGVASALTMYVATDGAPEFFLLKVKNVSEDPPLSAACCVEWVSPSCDPSPLMARRDGTRFPDGRLVGPQKCF